MKYAARLLPQDKLNELIRLRSTYGSVMFVGDGINDAPVLAGADVGAAMGSGADAAIEAADVVFMNSSMELFLRRCPLQGPPAAFPGRTLSLPDYQGFSYGTWPVRICSMWMAVFADTGVAFFVY